MGKTGKADTREPMYAIEEFIAKPGLFGCNKDLVTAALAACAEREMTLPKAKEIVNRFIRRAH